MEEKEAKYNAFKTFTFNVYIVCSSSEKIYTVYLVNDAFISRQGKPIHGSLVEFACIWRDSQLIGLICEDNITQDNWWRHANNVDILALPSWSTIPGWSIWILMYLRENCYYFLRMTTVLCNGTSQKLLGSIKIRSEVVGFFDSQNSSLVVIGICKQSLG